MKKFLKVAGTLLAIAAAVAGGIVLYKKFFAPDENLDDFDDDLDDDFEEDLDGSERCYTSLHNVAEEVKEAAEEIVEEAKEEVAEAAEEIKETFEE